MAVDITAAMVRDFRARTGAGMMDAKRALVDADGDFDAAERVLKERGAIRAEKKRDRATGEGLVCIGMSSDQRTGILFRLACETDFVARSPDFGLLARGLVDIILPDSDVRDAQSVPSGASEKITEHISKLGENIRLDELHRLSVDGSQGEVCEYVHAGGRVGVLMALAWDTAPHDRAAVTSLGRDVAMQVAAYSPMSLSADGLDSQYVAEQRGVFEAQAAGKPAHVIEKIVEGRLQRMASEVCLLDMPFVKNEDVSVREHASSVAASLRITDFKRLQL